LQIFFADHIFLQKRGKKNVKKIKKIVLSSRRVRLAAAAAAGR
jgi:hypothetical protein